MILSVVSSTVSVNKWGESEGTKGLTFEVVPKDRDQLEIGDKYVFAAAGYRFLHKDRQLIDAKLSISADRSYLERKDQKPGKDVCGWAAFYPERHGRLGDYDPPMLEMVVVVEPQRFDELFHLRIGDPDAATIHVSIDGLEYGWEPDGSHQVWKLDGKRADRLAERKPITSFWISVRTFHTTEQTIREEVDRKRNQEFAELPDPEMRKLADPIVPPADAAATKLLEHCRALLIAILAVAVFALLRR